ncbi:MAG: DUF92 domain-containing protein [Anaerolineaceae bacterium]|nr:DUF92 domain-containing protein [Anaerolineaceae bacterium]
MSIILGFTLALIIAWVAKWKKSLNRSGAIAATIMGTIIFGLGGLSWAFILLIFFLSSSLLSRFKKHSKLIYDEKFSKTAERDAVQVLANGGLAMMLVLIHYLHPDNNWTWLLFAASLAAANADTWATELGVLSKKAPHLITNGKSVEPGTSGAISFAGKLASCAGAAMVALPAVFLWQGNLPPAGPWGQLGVMLIITLAGLIASLLDSLLGATVQAIYYCPKCQKETERHPLHTCQTPTKIQRGWPWLNNDLVNFSATVTGACSALLLAILFSFTSLFQIDGNFSDQTISINSPAFNDSSFFTDEYTCQGENRPIEIQWTSLPKNTRAVFIAMHDLDTPMGRIPHWLATASLSPDILSTTSIGSWIMGNNYAGETQYAGPCPPFDPPHRYVVHVYALNQPLDLSNGFAWQDAVNQLPGTVIAENQITGKYSR